MSTRFPGLLLEPGPLANVKSRTDAFRLRVYKSSVGDVLTFATYDDSGALLGGTRLDRDQVVQLMSVLVDFYDETAGPTEFED